MNKIHKRSNIFKMIYTYLIMDESINKVSISHYNSFRKLRTVKNKPYSPKKMRLIFIRALRSIRYYNLERFVIVAILDFAILLPMAFGRNGLLATFTVYLSCSVMVAILAFRLSGETKNRIIYDSIDVAEFVLLISISIFSDYLLLLIFVKKGFIHAPMKIEDFYFLNIFTILLICQALRLFRNIYFLFIHKIITRHVTQNYLEPSIIYWTIQVIDWIEYIDTTGKNRQDTIIPGRTKRAILGFIQYVEDFTRRFFKTMPSGHESNDWYDDNTDKICNALVEKKHVIINSDSGTWNSLLDYFENYLMCFYSGNYGLLEKVEKIIPEVKTQKPRTIEVIRNIIFGSIPILLLIIIHFTGIGISDTILGYLYFIAFIWFLYNLFLAIDPRFSEKISSISGIYKQIK